MRLLYVVHQFLPRHVTGTEQYVRSLALAMRDRGHEVEVLAFEPQIGHEPGSPTWAERDESVDGIPLRRVGIHLEFLPNLELADYRNPLAVRFLARFLGERQFDLAHVFHLRYIGIGAIDELHRAGLPVVVNLMDFWFLCPRFTLLRGDGRLCEGPPQGGLGCIPCLDPDLAENLDSVDLMATVGVHAAVAEPPPDLTMTPVRRARALIGRRERLFAALAQAEAIIAPSLFLRAMFVANGFPEGVLRHVPYGVDRARLGGVEKIWESFGERPVVLGYVGSLTRHKGLHVLIAAVRAIAGDRWRLAVHGSPATHPEYTDELQQLAGDDPRITFHGAFEPAALGQVLASLDLVVVPSLWYENTPFSLLEAQAIGLPVLASDLGGITECIVHGEDGLLFPAGDVAALTGAIREILADPSRLPAIGRQGQAERRSLADNADEFVALYAGLQR